MKIREIPPLPQTSDPLDNEDMSPSDNKRDFLIMARRIRRNLVSQLSHFMLICEA